MLSNSHLYCACLTIGLFICIVKQGMTFPPSRQLNINFTLEKSHPLNCKCTLSIDLKTYSTPHRQRKTKTDSFSSLRKKNYKQFVEYWNGVVWCGAVWCIKGKSSLVIAKKSICLQSCIVLCNYYYCYSHHLKGGVCLLCIAQQFFNSFGWFG